MDVAQFSEFVVNHWILSGLFLVVLSVLIVSEWRRQASGVPQLGPAATIALMNQQDAVVLDVREEGEVKKGRIADSVHVPLRDLASRLDKLEKYRSRPVVVCCRTGQRSVSAANTLRKHGFEQVYNLAGGIAAWEADKLPLRRSK